MTNKNRIRDMTPQEKAKELYNKFYNTDSHGNSVKVRESLAKQCALTSVEFAREQFYKHCSAEMCTDGTYDDHFDRLKQEIEKL